MPESSTATLTPAPLASPTALRSAVAWPVWLALGAALLALLLAGLLWQKLSFTHPVSQEPMAFESPIPTDMVELIEALRDDTRQFNAA